MRSPFQAGEPFNPYRMFTGLYIPEGLARCAWISAGAKLAWGRLARYAGNNGCCHPSVTTLAEEIGVSARQAQRYLAELERLRLIRRLNRFADRAQTSNGFEFLWHELFEEGVTDLSGEGVSDPSPRGVTDVSPKESQDKESQDEEKNRPRLSGRDSQKARFATGDRIGCSKQYARLREAFADYMQEGPNDERLYPTDRQVVDVMDEVRPATEEEVVACLRYLYHERGLRPGRRNGPRRFSWFRTVVGNYFREKRERQPPSPAPVDGDQHRLSEDRFTAMTAPLEVGASAEG